MEILANQYKIIRRNRERVDFGCKVQEYLPELNHQGRYSDHQNLKSRINSTPITVTQYLEIISHCYYCTCLLIHRKLEDRHQKAVVENLHVTKIFSCKKENQKSPKEQIDGLFFSLTPTFWIPCKFIIDYKPIYSLPKKGMMAELPSPEYTTHYTWKMKHPIKVFSCVIEW